MSPYSHPQLKSSLNSENCRECLWREATSGAEDKSIYLHVKTTQCLMGSQPTHFNKELRLETLGCEECGGEHLSHRNVACIKSITRCKHISPLVTRQCRELEENRFSRALEEPPFGCWFNVKRILKERGRRGISYVLLQIATSILSFRWARLDLRLWGCGMCCLAVRSCQPQRSTGEGGTVAVESAVIKGSTSRLRGNQSRCHFAPTVLACAHFQQLETCSALTSSPSAVVKGGGPLNPPCCRLWASSSLRIAPLSSHPSSQPALHNADGQSGSLRSNRYTGKLLNL